MCRGYARRNLLYRDFCTMPAKRISAICCNRFAGQCHRPMSVAQHSVYVSRLCQKKFALQGLLHDASETYLGDLLKWLKALPELKAYRTIECNIQRTIFHHFHCPLTLHASVKHADRLMVYFEGEQGFGRFAWENWLLSLPSHYYHELSARERKRIGPKTWWSWQEAEEIFLAEFRKLYD